MSYSLLCRGTGKTNYKEENETDEEIKKRMKRTIRKETGQSYES
jgi:hypothetical protein